MHAVQVCHGMDITVHASLLVQWALTIGQGQLVEAIEGVATVGVFLAYALGVDSVCLVLKLVAALWMLT